VVSRIDIRVRHTYYLWTAMDKFRNAACPLRDENVHANHNGTLMQYVTAIVTTYITKCRD
jgi:hypothetical protein